MFSYGTSDTFPTTRLLNVKTMGSHRLEGFSCSRNEAMNFNKMLHCYISLDMFTVVSVT